MKTEKPHIKAVGFSLLSTCLTAPLQAKNISEKKHMPRYSSCLCTIQLLGGISVRAGWGCH